jgi:phosphoglycolate phosphatase
MTKYSAVIFDLDGTLINSLEDLADSGNEALLKFGFSSHPAEAYKKFIGNGLRQMMKAAVQREIDEELADKLWKECKSVYSKNYLNKTCPYDNVINMLRKLKELGLKMAVCTNKPDKLANEVVEKLLGREYISVAYGEREGIPRKPDPASLNEAAKYLDVLPENTIYIGDSGVDMICGRRAGMLTAGALWGFRDREELVGSGVQILLASPMELIDYLEKAES